MKSERSEVFMIVLDYNYFIHTSTGIISTFYIFNIWEYHIFDTLILEIGSIENTRLIHVIVNNDF